MVYITERGVIHVWFVWPHCARPKLHDEREAHNEPPGVARWTGRP